MIDDKMIVGHLTRDDIIMVWEELEGNLKLKYVVQSGWELSCGMKFELSYGLVDKAMK